MSFIDSINTPETWRWAISTVITVISIFGAAYFAQRVFNRNARIREDRERRLLGLKELLTLAHELSVLLIDMGGSRKQVNEDWSKMLHCINKAYSIEALLNLELKDSIDQIENDLNLLSTYQEEALKDNPTDEDVPLPAVSNEIQQKFSTSIGSLTKGIIDKFNAIEK